MLGDTGDAYLINQDGYVITPSRFEDELKQEGLIQTRSELELHVDSVAAQAVLDGNDGTAEYVNERDHTVIGAYYWISDPGWGLIAEQDVSEAYSAATFVAQPVIYVSLGRDAPGIGVSLDVSADFEPIRYALHVAERCHRENDQKVTYQKLMRSVNWPSRSHMIVYQREMAECARAAAGDLTVNLIRRSDEDLLGNSSQNGDQSA